MSQITTSVEFSSDIQAFLSGLGYTHIYNQGITSPKADIDIEKAEHDQEEGDYILIPLRPSDPRLTAKDTDMIINEINSHEVTNMTSGDPFIKFLIEIPGSEYELYLKK